MTQTNGTDFSDGFYRIEDFLAEDLGQDRQIAGPFSCGEIAIIAAPTGSGKTWLALALTNAIRTGKQFLYFDVPEKSKVMHIDGEMSGKKLQSRMRCFDWAGDIGGKSLGCQWTWRKAGVARVNLADPEVQAEILAASDAFDVIVFDNVYSLVSVPGQSMSSDTFWQEVMPLNLGLREKNKLVIWFDHTNNAGRIYGTKTKEWQVDYVGVLSKRGLKEKGKLQFDLEWTKTRGRDDYPVNISVEMSTDNTAGMCEWSFDARMGNEELIESVLEDFLNKDNYDTIARRYSISKTKVSSIKKEYYSKT